MSRERLKADFCCAYCGETTPAAFNREHVIPKAFGTFYDENGAEVVLKNRVCSSCNGSFKKFEQRHTRESFDVFFRNKFLVKGRKPNEPKPNPYKKRADGTHPVIVKGRPPGTSHDVYFQMDSIVGASQPTAAHFIHPKSMELIQLELSPKMDRAELSEKLKKLGYQNGMDLNLHCRPGDEEWFTRLFEKENVKLGAPPKPFGFRAYVEGGYGKEDFRSIAKIGFNYMMKFNNQGLSGRERSFGAIRAFIRDGVGSPLDFCEIPKLLPGSIDLVGPSHVASLEATREIGLVTKLHLFAQSADESPFHLIRLGPSPFEADLTNPICVHRFEIKSGRKDSGRVVGVRTPPV